MEMLICPEWEAKSISHRWQVSHKSKPGNRGSGRKFKICRSAERAARKADELFARGIQSTIEPVLTDFYIINHCGGIVLFRSRMLPLDAAKVANDYSTVDRVAGVLLWPHGTKLPKALQSKVVEVVS